MMHTWEMMVSVVHNDGHDRIYLKGPTSGSNEVEQSFPYKGGAVLRVDQRLRAIFWAILTVTICLIKDLIQWRAGSNF